MIDLKKFMDNADAIVIGAGAGLSAAAGFEYGGETFLKNFKYMHDLYGYNDMYSAGFHNFDNLEEKWGYWAKMIYLNRYCDNGKQLYKNLFALVKNKNYFVITTNVDHQFQKSGFDKKRLFYTQGDYGLFQCSEACHNKTYDNENIIKKMLLNLENHKISTSLIPRCPKCGAPMTTNLRCDDKFVEDSGWYKAKKRYETFLSDNKNKKIVFLELGVGFSTPVWIKYPFLKMTLDNPLATYICIGDGLSYVPNEIKDRSIIIKQKIQDIIK